VVLGTVGCGTSPEFREEVIETDIEEYVPVGKMKSLVGNWKGTGEQSNGSSWDMVLQVTSHTPGRCATIRYPSSGCSGYWECISAFDGVQLDAIEHITKGRDRCVNEVDVQLVVDDGGRTISFYAATGEITAEGRLARQR
jgi:hypothetical protein